MTRSLRAVRMVCILCASTVAVAGCGGEAPPVAATPPATPVPGATTPGTVTGGTTPALDPVTGLPVAPAPVEPTASVPELVGDDTSVSTSTFGAGTANDLFEPGGFESIDELGEPESPTDDPSPVTPGPAPTVPTSPVTPAPAAPKISYSGARIYVDGMVYSVNRDGTFPKGNPLFRLTAVSASSIEIELVAGEFTAGGANGTIIDRGQLLTMANASEGTVYRVKYLSPLAASAGVTF